MMLRAVVQQNESFQRRIRCRHTEYVRNGTFIMDTCQEVAPDHIKLGSSAEESYVVPFDFCIISTGSVWTTEGIKTSSPSMEYRIKQYDAERRKVATAKRVLIIGSGVVGNELCGEIIDAFPNKEVIMVGRSTLLRRAGPEAHRILSQHWKDKGVTCYYNEEMLPYKDGDTHYETAKGTKIPVDGTRTFWCTGRATPNSSFLRKHFPSALDKYDYIKIDEHCRVNGVPRGNIFACGDCTFGSAHPGGDRGTFGFNVHSFVARENVVAMTEQIKAGTPYELCICPQSMPFKIDPTCDSGSSAASVTSVQELSVGHDTHFLQFPALPEGITGSADDALVQKFQNGEVKTRCFLLKKGNEGRMKTYIHMVDMLRAPDEKTVPGGIIGYKLTKPGSDVKGTMDVWKLLFKNPLLSKIIFQQLVLKGKDKDCLLTAEQLAAGATKQLIEGEGLEIIDGDGADLVQTV